MRGLITFTAEDASVLALGTFGTSQDTDVLSMHFVATYDQSMMRQWTTQQSAIQKRFTAMQRNFPEPYHHAFLPQVQRPEHIIV